MFSYNKILVPYDGSKPSENALQQAIRIVNNPLARGRETTTNSMQEGGEGIQIILLHVVEEIHIRIPNMYIGQQVIIDIANNKQKVDLIIMGSTGLKGISKVRVLGSVSRHVCENATCPVMLVH